MDKLLQGLVLAPPDKVAENKKPGIVAQVLGLKAPPEQIQASLVLAEKWLASTEQTTRRIGRQVVLALASKQPNTALSLLGPRWMSIQLQRDPLLPLNLEAVHSALLGMRFGVSPSEFASCLAVVKAATRQLAANPSLPEDLQSPLVDIYLDFPQCVADSSGTCQSLVCWLGESQYSMLLTANGKPRLETVQKISLLLSRLWGDQPAAINASLTQALSLLTGPSAPSPVLQLVTQHVPNHMAEQATASIATSGLSDSSLKIAAARMVQWALVPLATNAPLWVIAMLKGLIQASRFGVFSAVAEQGITHLFAALETPSRFSAALPVATFLLVHYRGGPHIFHKAVPQIPPIISNITEPTKAIPRVSESDLIGFALLIHAMIGCYSGHPDLYGPVIEAVTKLPIPTEERVTEWLKEQESSAHVDKSIRPLEEEWTDVAERSVTGRTGLVNLGNTCYLNSVLQALNMSTPFRNLVLSFRVPPVSNPSTNHTNGNTISNIPNGDSNQSESAMKEIQLLFAQLLHTVRPAIEPRGVLSKCTPSWFTRGQQQDCDEQLKFLLDMLDRHEIRVSYANKTDGKLENPNLRIGDIPNGDKSDAMEIDVESAPVVTTPTPAGIFTGELTYEVTCGTCHQLSTRKENFTDLALSFPPAPSSDQSNSPKPNPLPNRADRIAVDNMVGQFLSAEQLTGTEQYFCEKCETKRDATKHVRISSLPECLVLVLKRFSYDPITQGFSKIKTKVDLPLVLAVPEPACAGSDEAMKRQEYFLYAVIFHAGISFESGHYYCAAREVSATTGAGDEQSQWYLFNDSTVSSTTLPYVRSISDRFSNDTPYLLLYSRWRMHLDPPPSLPQVIMDAISRDNATYKREKDRRVAMKDQNLLFERRDVRFGDGEDGTDGGGFGGGLPHFIS